MINLKTLSIILTLIFAFNFNTYAKVINLSKNQSVTIDSTTVTCMKKDNAGTCNIHGCSSCGTCNIHGCWDGANGSCNIHGCSSNGECNIHGCP